MNPAHPNTAGFRHPEPVTVRIVTDELPVRLKRLCSRHAATLFAESVRHGMRYATRVEVVEPPMQVDFYEGM